MFLSLSTKSSKMTLSVRVPSNFNIWVNRFRLSDAWLLLGRVLSWLHWSVCVLFIQQKTWIGIRTSRRWGTAWFQVRNGLAWICLAYERLHRSPHKPKQPLLLLAGVKRHSGYSAGTSYQHWAGFEENWPGFLGWGLLWLVLVCAWTGVKGECCGGGPSGIAVSGYI